MNRMERLEYVGLRVVRRFLVTEKLANRFARWIPYYRPSINEAAPERIVDAYRRTLASEGVELRGKHVVEIGAGRTNAVCHALAALGAQATALEPFVPFDAGLDARLAKRAPSAAHNDAVRRVTDFSQIPDGSVDVVFSNSVLEHVSDLDRLFAECHRVLRCDGLMVHHVDYRDHFFKYPYGFLTFSDETWNRWLNPGDLPRWRADDHVHALARARFRAELRDSVVLGEDFERVRPHLAARFSGRAHAAIATATLLAWRQ